MPTIAEIMSPDVQVVSPEQSLQTAARLMRECDVGALPVCDGQRLLGMVTDRDIAVRGVAIGLAPEDGCVSDVMSLAPQSCTPEQDAKAVMRVMAENQIRRLPVVDGDQQVVGIVSLGDLALRQSAPIEQTVRAISEPPAGAT